MCRNIADGGRRCPGNGKKATNSALSAQSEHAPSVPDLDGLTSRQCEDALHEAFAEATTRAEVRAIADHIENAPGLSKAALKRLEAHDTHILHSLADTAGKRTPWVDPVAQAREAKKRAAVKRNTAWTATDVDVEEAFSTRPLIQMNRHSSLGRDLSLALSTGKSHGGWTVVKQGVNDHGHIVAAVSLSEAQADAAEREWGGYESLDGVAYDSGDGAIEFTNGAHGIVRMVEECMS